jgi:GntP family gluconate:H+ symporter
VAATAHEGFLLACVASTVLVLLLLVGRLRLHAALGLSIAALGLGIASGIPLERVPVVFASGVGEMMGHIAIILGMGAIIGRLLLSSGAGTALGKILVERCGQRGMPWALLALGILVGMPVFFEVGLVLLMPVIVDAAERTGRPAILVSLPVLAGLSITHGLLPPHPGALLATTEYHARLAPVLLWGLIAGTPAAVVAGPILEKILIRLRERRHGKSATETGGQSVAVSFPVPNHSDREDPSPAAGAMRALVVILLPVALILVGGWSDTLAQSGSLPNLLLHFAGFPDVAMIIGALVALAALGCRIRDSAYRIPGGLRKLTADAFIPIAGPLFILAAAGGLSAVLRASGAAQAAVSFALGAHMPPLLLAWALAAAVRVSMGSSTVAIGISAGILAPMAGNMGVRPEMLVLATGSGSLFLSHVNDSGFWLVGSLFKMDVRTTLSTWSVLETVLSVSGLVMTLLLAAVLK